uniref:Uncharacterized protein n=1 Tax=Arundo donax TaxID=35708 RepID=A0A0A9HNB2_ARUDO
MKQKQNTTVCLWSQPFRSSSRIYICNEALIYCFIYQTILSPTKKKIQITPLLESNDANHSELYAT